jgi:F420H(2)-dependent quinone reductase
MGVPLFGQEHVDRYRETDGEEGHDWQGTTVLLPTTTGRNSGAKRTTPLIYQRHGDDYLWWPPTAAPYDEFQAKADREIPVVVLEPG